MVRPIHQILFLLVLLTAGCLNKTTGIARTTSKEFCELSASDLGILNAHNTARATARTCGGVFYAATHKLSWHCTLKQAALDHATDMAKTDFVSHAGSNQLMVPQRVAQLGYKFQAVGENIAAGSLTVEAVMAGWLKSPEHCANIMHPEFTQMGAVFVSANDNEYPTYWTVVFAKPMRQQAR